MTVTSIQTSHNCDYCKKENVTSKCGRCKKIYYCDAECQKNAWAAHKVACQAIAQTTPCNDNDGKAVRKWPPVCEYIISRKPHKYGMQHADYVKRSRTYIKDTVREIHSTVESNGDLEKQFLEMVESLSEKRADIARLHKTDGCAEFRFLRNGSKHGTSLTPLIGVYAEYGAQLKNDLLSHLHKLVSDGKTRSVPNPTCLGIASSLEFTLIPRQDYEKYLFSEQNLKPIYKFAGVDLYGQNSIGEIQQMKAMVRLHNKSPSFYNRLNLIMAIRSISKTYQVDETLRKEVDWALCAVKCEVGGKMQTISQYVLPAHKSIFHSMPVILHQDPLIIRETLNECAKIFKAAIEWNEKEGLEELQNKVALLVYLFSHAMPYARGSAALSEWIETAIYNFHGIEIGYNPRLMANLEALTLSLPDFIKNYRLMVQLSSRKSLSLPEKKSDDSDPSNKNCDGSVAGDGKKVLSREKL